MMQFLVDVTTVNGPHRLRLNAPSEDDARTRAAQLLGKYAKGAWSVVGVFPTTA